MQNNQYTPLPLIISDRYATELAADLNPSPETRQVTGAFFSQVAAQKPSHPSLIHASVKVAEQLGLSAHDVASPAFLACFSGAQLPNDMRPYAMCYGGHQFGQWAGQLGDGRAINLAEVIHAQQHFALQLKGAGKTPYSRMGDGLAVLRSSLREYLCAEAMHYLGVPTTRSLSLMLTGDQVMRDMYYDGRAKLEPGAIVCRVAPSFIRFGHFELVAAHHDVANLKQLADFVLRHHFPEITVTGKSAYIALFDAVAARTRDMVVQWQRVGFVHGVMNTDNMSILGLTLDYGPYGWMEDYNPMWTPNTTDSQYRYCFANQPQVCFWNLFQLANALYPLIQETEPLERILAQTQADYARDYHQMMCAKIGLPAEQVAPVVIETLIDYLQRSHMDMTLFFRQLAKFDTSHPLPQSLDDLQWMHEACYRIVQISGDILADWLAWFGEYARLLQHSTVDDAQRRSQMNQVNPKYVLRNYMAQLAIDAAEQGDYGLIAELSQLLQQPYAEQETQTKWYAKRPDWALVRDGCSALSCSS